MFKKIKDTILDKLFYVFYHGCNFCLSKARRYLRVGSSTLMFNFWMCLSSMCHKIEKRIYVMQYGKAL